MFDTLSDRLTGVLDKLKKNRELEREGCGCGHARGPGGLA